MVMEIDPLPIRRSMVMTMVMISPSWREVPPGRTAPPEPQIGSASWRRSFVPKGCFLFFFSSKDFIQQKMVIEEPPGGPRGRGAPQGGAPPPLGKGWGPPGLPLWRGFFIIFSKVFHGVSGLSENICFLHIKQHQGNSAENNVNPGQFHSNHTGQSPKQGQKCLEKQIRRRRISEHSLKYDMLKS